MGEVIDPTWIAFHSETPLEQAGIEAGIDRVADHYEQTATGELRRNLWSDGRIGVICLADPERPCHWPAFEADRRHVFSSAYVPTGWERLAPSSTVAEAPLRLAGAIAERPSQASVQLDAPAVIAVAVKEEGRLVVVNDCLGAGRLYEGSFEGLTIWSNRLGAIPLLAGSAPAADQRAWELFAAMGWFIRDATPIDGCRRVPPGTVIDAGPGAITRSSSDGLADLVAPPERPLTERIEQFAAEAKTAARAAAELFPAKPKVDLSGGRDSRLAAAVFIAAGVPARFVTSDMTSGEADVARGLFERLEGDLDHDVRWAGAERKRYDKGLRERARAVHLLHDGMRHASKVRGKMTLPPLPSAGASISGHGGEIAHGFYYTTPRALSKLESGGREALIGRLEQAARRRHRGARSSCYERARVEIEASLGEGAALGVRGATLLDWFYLMERFSHRSGLAADTQRITFFSCRGFLAAAFALTPQQRLDNELHRTATAALVPAWADVPYFRPKKARRGSLWAKLRGRVGREEKRPMIWEGDDGGELAAMIEAEGAWTTLYEPDRVRQIWGEVRGGSADPHYQDVFEGIAYREAFDDHLALLSERAAIGAPLVESRRTLS